LTLFTPNTKDLDNFFEKAKFVMIWRITIAFSFVFSILILLSFSNVLMLVSCFSLLTLASSSLYYLKIKRKTPALYWIYVIFGTAIVHFSLNTIPSYTHFVDFLWIMVIILLSFIGLGKKNGFAISLINISGIIYFYIFGLNNHIETLQPLSNLKIGTAIIEVMLCLFCVTYLINQYVKFNTYYSGELEKTNDQLVKKNEENIFLVKEIHHRVKNNLQIVISLLRLQKGELKSDEAKRHFNEAINRIMVMSLIHKKLYQEVEMAHIEIEPYLKDLANDVIHISNMGPSIIFEVNSEIKNIGLKTIVPLGLLINELLSNSIKHAFNQNNGFISVSILKHFNKDQFTLIYVDDGKWIDLKENQTGFGLGLIETLSEQLEGTFTRQQSEYTFELKNLDN